MAGSIPRPCDHDLRQRQTLNQVSHPGAPNAVIFYKIKKPMIIHMVPIDLTYLSIGDINPEITISGQ